ncbi:MAG: hypothetical protein BGO29_02980 [Bacteroidales bacterium 36-12]|nr:MAG: hypothetical protein BGO29_02980 [Bacteroidales bacterium 36-12]
MKQKINYLLALVFIAIAMVSCMPEDDIFDETLLYGKWKSGTEFYRFDSDGKGKNWDAAETEEDDEGGSFTWTLVKADLTVIRITTTTGSGIPHTYTVLELTSSKLKFNDGFEDQTFSKVN